MSELQPLYTPTPWRARKELLDLRDKLFFTKTQQQAPEAFRIIEAWKLRGNLPHAVESTGLLLQAQHFHRCQEMLAREGGKQIIMSTFPIRATYATAITRFVTGYADIGRHKSGPGQTMLEVAATVGLSVDFVELRHEATHGDLPSLGRLMRATDKAIKWLQETYWSGLESERLAVSDIDSLWELADDRGDVEPPKLYSIGAEGLAELKADMKSTLKEYRRFAKVSLQHGQDMDPAQTQNHSHHLVRLAGSVRGGNKILAQVLCSPGFMIPSETNISNSARQMQTAFDMFEPLLHTMASDSSKFMKALLAHIALLLVGELQTSEAAKSGLLAWCSRIFDEEEWAEVLGSRHLNLVLYYRHQIAALAEQDERLYAPVKPSLRRIYPQDEPRSRVLQINGPI